MISRRYACLAIACAGLLVTSTVARAADPIQTTISVTGMHCVACASKVAGNLKAIGGVQGAEVSAEKSVAVVTAKANAALSPRALWEAVEKAGYKPTKIVGPSGTFTSKPKS